MLHHDTSLFIDYMKSGQVLVYDVFIHGHHCHQLSLLFLGYLQWAMPCTKCFTYIIEFILHGNYEAGNTITPVLRMRNVWYGAV